MIKRSYYQEKILLRLFSGKILGGTICQAFHFLVIVSLSVGAYIVIREFSPPAKVVGVGTFAMPFLS